MKPNDSKS